MTKGPSFWSRFLFLFLLLFHFSNLNLIAQPSVEGTWSPVYTGDMIPVASANLPNGDILSWSAYSRFDFGGDNGRTYTSIFDISNNSFNTTLIANTGHDMFCPGIANIKGGEIVITGGSSSAKTTIYNPANNTFRAGDEMNVPRGYHAMCTLDDGRVFTLGGSWSGGRFNKDAEVWSEETGWYTLGNVNSDITVRQGAPDPDGIYRDDNHAWIFAAPGGRVFQAGPGTNMHWISTIGQGEVLDAGRRGNDNYAMNGNAVMYDIGKILTTGGAASYNQPTYPATNSAFTIDISNERDAVVSRVGALNETRVLHNSVVLPNGEVVVTGGQCQPQLFTDVCARYETEIWNPNTESFREVASMQTPRTYHSVSILMKDGRVWVAGGGLCGDCDTNHPDAEIYSPPYLFNNNNTLATRPVIENAPNAASYNTSISVSTNVSVQEFVLMRMSSATHSVNNEQRRIPLTFSSNGGNNYNVNIPERGWVPPGNYFLFAIKNGVPSIAATIDVGSNAATPGDIGQVVADGTYYIESLPTGQHLAIPSFDADNIRMVDQETSDDQKWEIIHIGSGVYTVKNIGTDGFLHVPEALCANGANIAPWPEPVANNVRWIISKEGNEYFFQPVHCTDQAMDNGNGNNTNVLTWVFSVGNNNQRFILKNSNTIEEPENHIAIGKPATQSSTGWGGVASRAVDGNTDGSYNTGESVSHTQNEIAWWRVDLEGVYDISSITIHNRTDCCADRLDGASLYIGLTDSNNPDDYTKLSDLNGNTQQPFINVNRQARYVMVRLNSANFLSLAEVEVYGTLSGNQNEGQNENENEEQNGNENEEQNGNESEEQNGNEEQNEDEEQNENENQNQNENENDRVRVNGAYLIRSLVNGQNAISPVWADNNVRTYSPATVYPDHKWKFTHVGDDKHTITNLGTDRYLTVDNAGCSNGSNVGSATNANSDNSLWYIEKVGNNYFLTPVHCTSHALDQNANGVNIIVEQYNRNNNQQWDLIPAEDRLEIDGVFTIRSKVNNQNAISPTWDNFNVRTYSSGRIYLDHEWQFEHIGDGRHTIQNKGTNRYLQVNDAVCGNGANVDTWPNVNADNVRWYVELSGDDYYLIPVHCESQALDQNANGVNIITQPYDRNNNNQKWDIIPNDGSARPRSTDFENYLRATPTFGQQTTLTWYAVQKEVMPVKSYTFQHVHEDGEDFVDIHQVNTSNDFGFDHYDFVHTKPLVGKNYYQIKIEYIDGSVNYSNFRMVEFEPQPYVKINIAPNPAQEYLNIELSKYTGKSVHYFISTANGTVLTNGVFDENHSDVETITLASLRNGNYLLYLRPEGKKEITTQFVIMKDY